MESVESQNLPNVEKQLRDRKTDGSFVQCLKKWLTEREIRLQPNEQLRLTAILPGGKEILVGCISSLTSDNLIVDGIDLQSGKPCNLISRQESLQLVCMVEPVKSIPRHIRFK